MNATSEVKPFTYVVRKVIDGWTIVYINADRTSRPMDGGKIYPSRQNAYRRAKQLNDYQRQAISEWANAQLNEAVDQMEANNIALTPEHLSTYFGEEYELPLTPEEARKWLERQEWYRQSMKRSFTYEVISLDDLTSSDLREAYVNCSSGTQVLRIRILNANEKEQAERAEALFDPEAMRMGIAEGGDATWADVDGLESGVDMYLNDGEAWSQRS